MRELTVNDFSLAALFFQAQKNVIGSLEYQVSPLYDNFTYFVSSGLRPVIQFLREPRFVGGEIRDLREKSAGAENTLTFLANLKNFRFTGDLKAIPEGQIFFRHQPVLQITAPIFELLLIQQQIRFILEQNIFSATRVAHAIHSSPRDLKLPTLIERSGHSAGFASSKYAARSALIAGCKFSANILNNRPYQSEDSRFFDILSLAQFKLIIAEKNAENKKIPVDLLIGLDCNLPPERRLTLPGRFEYSGEEEISIPALKKIVSGFRAQYADTRTGEIKIGLGGNFLHGDLESILTRLDVFDFIGFDANHIVQFPQIRTSFIAPFPANKYWPLLRNYYRIAPEKSQVYRLLDARRNYIGDIVAPENEQVSRSHIPLLTAVLDNGQLLYDPPDLAEIQHFFVHNLDKFSETHISYATSENYPVEFRGNL